LPSMPGVRWAGSAVHAWNPARHRVSVPAGPARCQRVPPVPARRHSLRIAAKSSPGPLIAGSDSGSLMLTGYLELRVPQMWYIHHCIKACGGTHFYANVLMTMACFVPSGVAMVRIALAGPGAAPGSTRLPSPHRAGRPGRRCATCCARAGWPVRPFSSTRGGGPCC